jgi:hypothetical protein
MIFVAAVAVLVMLLLLQLFIGYLYWSKGELILEEIAPLLNELRTIQAPTRISSNGIDDSSTLAGHGNARGRCDAFRGFAQNGR